MTEKNHDFPTGLQAVGLVIALMMAEYVAGTLLYAASGTLALSSFESGVLAVVLGNGVIFTAVMQHKGLGYRALLHPSSASVTATVLLLVPAIALTVPALMLAESTMMHVVLWAFPMSNSEAASFSQLAGGGPVMLVLACVLAPLLEEMLFRGIILRSFLGQYERWPAICGSAALFGAAHLNLYQFLAGATLGIVLGWLYERSRSLWPCVALHALYNGACMALYAAGGEPGAMMGDASALTWVLAMGLGAAGAWFLRRVLGAASSA